VFDFPPTGVILRGFKRIFKKISCRIPRSLAERPLIFGAACLFLLPIVFMALSVQAGENDWINWQELFNRQQTEKGHPPNDRSIHIKDIEVTGTLNDYPGVGVSGFRQIYRERCITCHDGIAEISKSHPENFGCTVCHGGDGNSVEKELAHATLIYDPDAGTGKRNPSSLKVVEKSCGQLYCHSGHAQSDRNHIQRVKKSMMATLSGMISGLRYQWSAQSGRKAIYGVNEVVDEDGQVPVERGALPRLDTLPLFSPLDGRENPGLTGKIKAARVSRNIADRTLRKKCFQCHLDSKPAPGEFRSQGCAACHFTYSSDGLYKGDDPTIARTEKGHPSFHKMTALTPTLLCTQCHKATGMVREESKEETNAGTSSTPLDFPGAGQILKDVHFEKGFDCIDCHTQFDIMGDGNLYSKQYQAVEIRCETCHGNSETLPLTEMVTDPDDRVIRLSRHYNGWANSVSDEMILSMQKRKLTNVKIQEKKIVTFGKKSGKAFITPTIKNGRRAHIIPAHKKKLECSACHSQWVPECTGCHSIAIKMKANATGEGEQDNSWQRQASSLKVTTPALMIGPRGKVMPMLAQPDRTLTLLDEQGNPIAALAKNGDTRGRYRNWKFTNPHGYSGSNLAFAVSPHSVGKKVRSCASCHLSPESLGLGKGEVFPGTNRSGKNDKMEFIEQSNIVQGDSVFAPDAKVDLLGKPLAGVSQTGARPFNQREITRILRVGNCLPCHDKYSDRIYQNIKKSYAFEKKPAHRKLIDNLINKN
jgi:hypothetical protein